MSLPSRRVTVLALLALLFAPPVPLALSAQATVAIEVGAPEEVGLSSEVLAKVGPTMQKLIDEGRTGGIMTLVARRGRVVHWEARGSRVVGQDALEPNDIFRIYSMTKPVTSVAVMMLVEEGRLSLDDDLARFIPAFAGARVYESRDSSRPPSRPITIRDLLTHTSGLTYGAFGNTPVDSIYRRERVLEQPDKNLAEWAELVASMPLLADPGTRWNYSVSTDVLGRVVEAVSGMPLDRFFRERIFDPLDMEDTGFHVPPEKLDRFVAVYRRAPEGLRMTDSPVDGPFTRAPTFLSGGGGLTSTAADYLRFARMLLNDGELDGVRLLRPETVARMRRNHLPEEMIPIFPGGDLGFGLGFSVSVVEDPGTFAWAGVANTYFWIDPAEELIGFAWTQFMPFGQMPLDTVLKPIVYEAIVEGR